MVFKENGALAEECYDSLDTSRKELSDLAQDVIASPQLDAAMEERYAEAAGASMRELEHRQGALWRMRAGGVEVDRLT